MILQEYLRKVKKDYGWFEIADEIVAQYPDQEDNLEGYAAALTEMLEVTPVLNPMVMYVEIVEELGADGDVDYWGHVYGKNGKTYGEEYAEDDNYPQDGFSEEFLEKEIGYALELTPWEELMGMEVSTILPPLETVAHVLYELTFFGFTNEKVQKKAEEISGTAEDAREALANGEYDKFASIDDLLGEDNDNTA